MNPEQRDEIIRRIKERVYDYHAVSVIKTISEYRSEMMESNPDFYLRIEPQLIESISTEIIKDSTFERSKNEKDYYISLKKKHESIPSNTNISIRGNFEGNLINQSSLDKSFNPDQSSKAPTKKSSITVGDIVKIISGIVVITLAALKGCGII